MKLISFVSLRSLLCAAVLSVAAASPALALDITGAGATFPYPLYSRWASEYKKTTDLSLNYQSIGSGGGINQIKAKTVDFGASDKPLTPAELDAAGLTQFPAVIGGVVLVYNLPEVPSDTLQFTPALLANIYLGKISKWNDPEIAKLNPGVALPDTAISVIRRADGSGTTFLFTDYLSKISPEWKTSVGAETSVKWPTGLGGKGNEGVANYVRTIKGSIGYVEYAYAKQSKLSVIKLQNADGKFVSPSEDAFKAATAKADWAAAPGFSLILTNQPGAQSWPIAGASFILMQKTQDKPENGKAVLKFFEWSFEKGDKMADELDYVALPDSVVKLIKASWKTTLKDSAGKAIY